MVILRVDGISCEGCVTTIKNALSGLEGIGAVSVDLAQGMVSVEAAPDKTQQIVEVIDEAGYEVRSF